jgi:hypothetical protein
MSTITTLPALRTSTCIDKILPRFRAGLYVLTIPGVGEEYAARGDLDVTKGTGTHFTSEFTLANRGTTTTSGADLTLPAGGRSQIGPVLKPYGLSKGYAGVTLTSGTSAFVAYGVLNDGSYVEMTVVR